LIRYGFFGGGARGGRFVSSESLLAVAISFPAFGTLLIPAIGGAQLLPAGLRTAGIAAVSLPAIASGAEEEKAAASGCVAEPLAEGVFRGR
jgi:hypothetical protein